MTYSGQHFLAPRTPLRSRLDAPLFLFMLLSASVVSAQHRHDAPMPTPTASPTPAPAIAMPSPIPSPTPHMHMNMPMPSSTASPAPDKMAGMGASEAGPLAVIENGRMGIRVGSSKDNVMLMSAVASGTSSQPSSAPMYMQHWTKHDWLLMFHYNIFADVNGQGGPRGVTQFESANWFMPMAYRRIGPGTLQLRGMLSAEPFTFPPGGSPLLFQTGETYQRQPLIDRQHPHDLFMELSAQYTLALGDHATWFTYFGYPGEPALGPVAFMHRASASEDPAAPLAHHLQDSTHISFGVLTTGFTYHWFKIEGSVFNGREPDENRYGLDAHKWNSRSARIWWMPNANWAIQVSHGLLRSPETQEPEIDMRRTTASVQYNRTFTRGNWASAVIWGRNRVTGNALAVSLNGYTAESTVNFSDKNFLFTRLELADKDDLLNAADRALLGLSQLHPVFRIGAYTLGAARDFWTSEKVSLAFGSDVTFYSKPPVLDRIYGKQPVSWELFLRIRPSRMTMSSHAMHRDQP